MNDIGPPRRALAGLLSSAAAEEGILRATAAWSPDHDRAAGIPTWGPARSLPLRTDPAGSLACSGSRRREFCVPCRQLRPSPGNRVKATLDAAGIQPAGPDIVVVSAPPAITSTEK
jgi:hypothetical protein